MDPICPELNCTPCQTAGPGNSTGCLIPLVVNEQAKCSANSRNLSRGCWTHADTHLLPQHRPWLRKRTQQVKKAAPPLQVGCTQAAWPPGPQSPHPSMGYVPEVGAPDAHPETRTQEQVMDLGRFPEAPGGSQEVRQEKGGGQPWMGHGAGDPCGPLGLHPLGTSQGAAGCSRGPSPACLLFL